MLVFILGSFLSSFKLGVATKFLSDFLSDIVSPKRLSHFYGLILRDFGIQWRPASKTGDEMGLG